LSADSRGVAVGVVADHHRVVAAELDVARQRAAGASAAPRRRPPHRLRHHGEVELRAAAALVDRRDLDRRAAAATSTSLLKVPFASSFAGWPLTVIECHRRGLLTRPTSLRLPGPRTTAVLRPRVATKMGSRICSVPARRREQRRPPPPVRCSSAAICVRWC
jgi:hypothetical protein